MKHQLRIFKQHTGKLDEAAFEVEMAYPETKNSGDRTRTNSGFTKRVDECSVDGDSMGGVEESGSVGSGLSLAHFRLYSAQLLAVLILALGLATSGAFLGIGLSSAIDSQVEDFERSAEDIVVKTESSFHDYVNAASIVHGRCRHRGFTRSDFRELYEYLIASDLQFKAVQFDPNITHEERAEAEEEARQYYAEHYPHVNYRGIRGFNTLNATSLEPRTNQSFYFPIHYQEPIEGNEAAIDLDYHSSESRMRALYAAIEEKAPSMTDRLSLVKEKEQVSRCGDHDGPSYGVVLMHPGVPLTSSPDVWPRDISSVVLCIPDLLVRSISTYGKRITVYIHDRSHPTQDSVFMGGASHDPAVDDGTSMIFLDEIGLNELGDEENGQFWLQQDIEVANRIWTITVTDEERIFDANVVFVMLGGIIIVLASILLAIWILTSDKRTKKYNALRAATQNERAALILQNARQATKTERELNDFIAHEVRNPVAAAMAACNFVKMAIHKPAPLRDEDSLQLARGDINIIDNSLHFVNDLLRNMLDMHRAASKQLHVNMRPVDLLHDVLEPVGGMLHQRGSRIDLHVECPENLCVMADCLRLKQVILNLGRNSTKFVDKGFIRLKAEEIDGVVKIYVDDTGSGIPAEKRSRLFTKFQESLDVLSQGTGIGLYLCKSLVELMGGKIYLDDNYHSGIEGQPGTRFVVDLQAGSIDPSQSGATNHLDCQIAEFSEMDDESDTNSQDLPEKLSILFVDDDSILRKLFARTVKSVRPEWHIREAANGEAALRLVDNEQFDIIFIDMYMASVEKQLLGTEAVAALRNKGITCRICGLSANDKQQEFFNAGADCFIYKPFPCDQRAMTNTLCRILDRGECSGDMKTIGPEIL